MMSEGGGSSSSSSSSSGQGRPITHHLWLRQRQQDDDDEDDDEEEGGGEETSKGGDVVVVGGGGATTLYSREDGATVLEAADGTTTVLRPHAHAGAHRLTVTVEGEEGGVGVVGGEGVTAIVDGQTGTATLVEGAEVVRTQAVSYATPILHQVFLQAAPPATSLAHTAHTTLLHTTTHAPALQPSVGRRPPPPLLACTTAPTPFILHPPRAALREESSSSSRLVEVVTGASTTTVTTTNTITTTSTTTCVVPDHHHHHHHLLPQQPPTASQSSSPSSSPPPALSPQSSSSSSSSSASSSCGVRTDDELTSLSWLQDSNLLRGTALSPVKTSPGMVGAGVEGGSEVVKAESPTSDYGDESSDALEPGELTLNDQPHTQPSRSQPIPYNPQVHVNAKPPYSFSCLIFMAIEDSANKALPVKDIYAWILDHFPYFRNAPTGWKNSVRHNLSLNKCFRKVEKAPNLGKGSLWMVDPAYRPNLLQALSKTPFHPYSNLDRIYMVSTKAAYNNRPVLYRHLTETVSGQGSVAKTTMSVESPVVSSTKPAGANVPDPELFPYLARRLGSSTVGGPSTFGTTGVGTPAPGVHSEDVDAAAAMLALKHGSRIVTPASESYSQLRDGKDTSVLYEESRKRKRKRKHTEVGDVRMMVISSSPSEDHSYTSVDGEEDYPAPPVPLQSMPNSSSPHSHPSPPKKANHSPTSSVDEAFSDDSYDSDVTSETSQADMRQLVEGADALLNLAAVATSLASQRNVGGGAIPPPSQNHQHHSSSSQRSLRPHNSSSSSRLGKVHILKTTPSRSSPSKSSHSSSKNKTELPNNNNNTIVNNKNKIFKVRRLGGIQGRGPLRHHLPTSH